MSKGRKSVSKGCLAGFGLLVVPGFSYAGIFEAYQAYPTGSWAEAAAIGDVNGDGLNDVVVTTSYLADPENDYSLFVFTQTKQGELAPPVRYDTDGTTPYSVGIGDVNNDGRNDVVVGSGDFLIFLQDDTGTLLPPNVLPSPYGGKLRVADLNTDGLTDVTALGGGQLDVGVYHQDSAGSLALDGEYFAYCQGVGDLDLGDVSGDGLTDIVVSCSDNSVAVLRQNAAGSFEPATVHVLGDYIQILSVGVGDVTGDGRSDVVATYGSTPPNTNIAVFAQNSDGSLATAVTMPSDYYPDSTEVADVTLDGLPDVVALHGAGATLGVYEQQPDGTLAPEVLIDTPYATRYNPHALAVGDINDDGYPDVAFANYNSGLVTLLNAGPQRGRPPRP